MKLSKIPKASTKILIFDGNQATKFSKEFNAASYGFGLDSSINGSSRLFQNGLYYGPPTNKLGTILDEGAVGSNQALRVGYNSEAVGTQTIPGTTRKAQDMEGN